jgi:hypothetical protein
MATILLSSDTAPLSSVIICCTIAATLNMSSRDDVHTLGAWTDWPDICVLGGMSGAVIAGSVCNCWGCSSWGWSSLSGVQGIPCACDRHRTTGSVGAADSLPRHGQIFGSYSTALSVSIHCSSLCVQTSSEAHPASYPIVTGIHCPG